MAIKKATDNSKDVKPKTPEELENERHREAMRKIRNKENRETVKNLKKLLADYGLKDLEDLRQYLAKLTAEKVVNDSLDVSEEPTGEPEPVDDDSDNEDEFENSAEEPDVIPDPTKVENSPFDGITD